MFPFCVSTLLLQIFAFKGVVNLAGITLALSMTTYGGLDNALKIPSTYHWYSLFGSASTASIVATIIVLAYFILLCFNLFYIKECIVSYIKYRKGLKRPHQG